MKSNAGSLTSLGRDERDHLSQISEEGCVEHGRDAPLVFYDLSGGMKEPEAGRAREHFQFLHLDWKFKLSC